MLGVLVAFVLGAGGPGKIGDTVHTTYGPVKGKQDLLDGFTTFHGVQFAADPVDGLRWKAPKAPIPWTEVRKADRVGPICPQLDIVRGEVIGREACLHLSVYVPPGCTESSPCPVMQWIYGGAWALGSNDGFGAYDGTKLAKTHGVVIVAANYRLDALGWMALQELQDESDSGGAYGNYGLRDQQFALRWTQANVHSFGGDPNQVTIFGESAGGFSVCQHIASPGSSGLFSAAIMESGDCDGPWLITDGADAKGFGDLYSRLVGCPSNLTTVQRLGCLRDLPLKDVLEPYLDWFCPVPRPDDPWCNQTVSDRSKLAELDRTGTWPVPRPPMAPIAGWTATVDGSQMGLPDAPYNLFKKGRVNKSPKGDPITVVFGSNEDEMALFAIMVGLIIPDVKLPMTGATFDRIMGHLGAYHTGWNATVLASVLAAYPMTDYKTEAGRFTAAATDLIFRCGTRDSARVLADNGNTVYLYHFNWHWPTYKDPDSELCELDTEVLCGVFHSKEVKYVFGDPKEKDATSRRVSDHMGTYWTNVAKYLSPNAPAGTGGSQPATWPRFNTTGDMHLEIAGTMSPGQGLHKKHCDFWDSLPKQGPYPSVSP